MSDLESVEVYLPDEIKTIVSLIGIANTEKLIKRFGGISFYLGKAGTYYAKIKAEIGEQAAMKLVEYAKGYLYLPKCDVALRVLRNRQLNQEFLAMTANNQMSGRTAMLELCSKYGLSDRQAWEIVHSFRRSPNHRQPMLF